MTSAPERTDLCAGLAALERGRQVVRRIRGFERITVDPRRMGGVPCTRDLRVTVGMVLSQLAGSKTVEQLLTDFPYLERAVIMAALEYAAAVVNEREVPIARPA